MVETCSKNVKLKMKEVNMADNKRIHMCVLVCIMLHYTSSVIMLQRGIPLMHLANLALLLGQNRIFSTAVSCYLLADIH